MTFETLDRRELLAGDLVGSWRAESLVGTLTDGQAVTNWVDSVSQLSATAEGTPKFAPQSLGGRAVIRFDASDGGDALNLLAATNPLSSINDFSVAVMFRTNSVGQGADSDWFFNTGIVDANQLAFGRDWGITLNSAGQVGAGVSGGVGGARTTLYSSAAPLTDGNGHVAVFTKAGATITLYIDGQEVSSASNADAEQRSVSGVSIGSLLSRTGYFTGDIGEVRMYNGGLTSAEATDVSNTIASYFNNQAPVAVNDTYETDEDALLFLVPKDRGVLVNDLDADGDALTATLVTPPQHGKISLNSDGSFLYDSDTNYHGTDSFTYTASDFRPGSTATVTLNVRPVYDPVQPKPDIYNARPGQKLAVFSLIGILANDTNVDRLPLTAELVTPPAQGQLTLQPDGSFTYDPQGFAGRTSFTYRVNDGVQTTAPTTVTLAITSPPQANPDVLTVDEDAQLVIFDPAQGVLRNDVDAEGDPLTVTLVDSVTNGDLTLQSNGSLYYKPNADFNGTDTFTYKINDGFDDSAVTTVTINVNPVNDLPSAVEDGYFILPGQTLTVAAAQGLLVNDFDLDGPQLSALLGAAPQHGTLDLKADGSFTYVPAAGFEGTDQFTYRASDSLAQTGDITVYVGVVKSPIEISELMSNNLTGLTTRTRLLSTDRFRGEKVKEDWLEIHNHLPFSIDVGGMYLSDSAKDLKKWQFPAGTFIPADGYLLVFASGLDIKDPTLDELGSLHTNFGLSSSGEFLGVAATDGSLLFSFGDGFPEQRPDISFGIIGGAAGYMLMPTPGAVNEGAALKGIPAGPTIDHDHGFFTQSIQVTITNNDPQSTLIYTLDGTEPTPENGIPYNGAITIDKTTVLRSAAIRDGYLTSRTDTRSFIYLADVVKQSLDGKPPEGWPARWGSNATDYGMDPDVVNSVTWGRQLEEALTQIPSMSIVTDVANLFDTKTGIYSHASSDGIAWERPASIELINPDGTTGFQQNIGLRIRGGFSRSSDNPKHAFRLFFDSPYGDGWLNYPLFGDEGTNSFAKVDLRTSQNYSWAFQNDNRNTFLRDIFSRDLQGEMGNQYTKGRFYHLYINGQYFGLYQTDERPEANFAASYYGGSPDDYDVIHNDPRQNGATNGNLEAYRRLWEHFVQDGGLGDANAEDYYRVQGMNADGTRNPEYERLLDVDNLIDYMIITYYTSDADGPGSKFTRPGLNNYFTIFNRDNPDGFKFFEHDSEHSLDTGNAAGANYNMVSPLVNNGRTFPQFNPHWMHEQLANSNSDYLIRFQDRVREVFADDGVLSDTNVFKILDNRASQIDMAIIAESARWGDAKRANNPYTKTDWERAVKAIKTWVTSRQRNEGRRAEVLTQLSREKWWNFSINSPTFSRNGGQVDAGYPLQVNLVGDGAIYVTTDGSDPRESGGTLNPKAILVSNGGQITVTSGMTVRARTLNAANWSPETTAQFLVEPAATVDSLRVSEIQYHPSDPTPAEEAAGFLDADEFEYIELVNVSDTTIDLSGVKLTETVVDFDRQGVVFDFNDGVITKLAPGAHVLVVRNKAAVDFRYGASLPIAGEFLGGLSNSGERITVQMLDGSKQQFAFDDNWHPTTDGDGPSLEIIDAASSNLASWGTADAWRPSFAASGSPGTGSAVVGDSNGDGFFDESDLILVAQSGKFEDGIAKNATFAEGDWNGDGDFSTEDLVYAFRYGMYRSQVAVVLAVDAAFDDREMFKSS